MPRNRFKPSRVPYAFTPIPLAVIDSWLPHMPGAALKAYTVICRNTVNRSAEKATAANIRRWTGMARDTTANALRWLEDAGLVDVKHCGRVRVYAANSGVRVDDYYASKISRADRQSDGSIREPGESGTLADPMEPDTRCLSH